MTGSRVNGFVWALAFALLTTAAIAADPEAPPTGGASAPPRGLKPAEQLPPLDSPSTVAPAQPETTTHAPSTEAWQSPTEQTVPDKPGAPSGPRVTVQGLSASDPSGAGLISQGSGGFGSNLWAGSGRSSIATRLAQLPTAPSSPAMQGLMRRLLLTAAAPPAGVAPPEEPSLLALRLAKLIANGWIGEAATLAAQSPRDDSFARQAWAEALLLQGREADACGDTTSLRQSSNDAYWLKLRALCYLLQKDTPSALLTLEVMRERGVTDDAFFALAAALSEGAAVKVAALPAPTGLHLSLFKQANKPPPPTVATWLPATPLLLQQSTSPDMRLAAAERAGVAGLLEVEQMRRVYEGETFSVDELDDPEEAAKKLTTARANALYFQAITKRTLPAGRATAFVAALQRADLQNRFPFFAAASAPLALSIKPGPETSWAAAYVARALLYAGNDKAAVQWLTAMASPTDSATVNALQIHLGLVRPTPENLARMQGAMTWLGQNALKPGSTKDWLMDRATREIPLLNALGYLVPPDAQWAISATTAGSVPSGAAADALAGIERAAGEGKLGETILDALIALGPGGPTRAQGHTVKRVVAALIAVGLRDEARALAIESVLGAPIRLRS